MARTKISEFSATAADNTDIDNIDIAEGCAPSGINNAIRELMSQLKDWQSGAVDIYTIPAGSVTAPSLSFNGDLNTGLYQVGADNLGIAAGGVKVVDVTATGMTYTGTLTGGTGIVNIGAGQIYKAADGAVGIGTASPGASLHVAGAITAAPTGSGVLAGIEDNYAVIHLNGSASTGGIVDFSVSGTNSKGRVFYDNASNFMSFSTNGLERARFDSAGNLLVGTAINSPLTATGAILYNDGTTAFTANSTNSLNLVRIGTSGALAAFAYGATGVGTITTNGTSTAYNTSSDYRLKENVAPMTGALDTVLALKPCTYTWKSNGSAGQGFIAHELQEVVPDCVTGEKDAVDAEGKPQYQGIDTSFLIATLVSAIQELKSEFDAYKVSHP